VISGKNRQKILCLVFMVELLYNFAFLFSAFNFPAAG